MDIRKIQNDYTDGFPSLPTYNLRSTCGIVECVARSIRYAAGLHLHLLN